MAKNRVSPDPGRGRVPAAGAGALTARLTLAVCVAALGRGGLLAAAAPAGSFTIAGSWNDRAVGAGGTSVVSVASGSFEASLPFSYNVASFDPSTVLTIGLGSSRSGAGVFITHHLWEDPAYTAAKRSATFTDHSTNGVGTLTTTVAWSGSRLTLSGRADYDLFSAELAFGTNAAARVVDVFDTNLVLFPDVNSEVRTPNRVFTNFIFVSASHRTETDDAAAPLSSGLLSGFADFTPPVVRITSPLGGLMTTQATLSVFGTFSDNVTANELPTGVGPTNAVPFPTNVVQYSTDGADFTALGGGTNGGPNFFNGTNWSTPEIALQAGRNEVFVRAVDVSGNTSAVAHVAITRLVLSPLTLGVVPDSAGGADGRISGSVSNGGNVVLGSMATVTATPDPGSGFVFNGWTLTNASGPLPSSQQNPLTFTMTSNLAVMANFTFFTNFSAATGHYAGLFFATRIDTNDLAVTDATNSGHFSLDVTRGGAYSGALTMLAGRFPFSGHLAFNPADSSFYAWLQVARAELPALPVRFGISGGVITNDTEAGNLPPIVGQAALSGALSPPHISESLAGTYNLILPASSFPAGAQHGHSYGMLKVDTNGMATLQMSLADAAAQGAPIGVTSGFLSRNDHHLSFFMPIYPGNLGLFMGEITPQATNGCLADIRATNLTWIKLPGASATFYPGGFNIGGSQLTNGLILNGAYYSLPPKTRAAGRFSGTVAMEDFDQPTNQITANVAFSLANGPISLTANTNHIAASFDAGSGLVSGTFWPDRLNAGRKATFRALFLPTNGPIRAGQEAQGYFEGYFLGPNQSGYVDLRPRASDP